MPSPGEGGGGDYHSSREPDEKVSAITFDEAPLVISDHQDKRDQNASSALSAATSFTSGKAAAALGAAGISTSFLTKKQSSLSFKRNKSSSLLRRASSIMSGLENEDIDDSTTRPPIPFGSSTRTLSLYPPEDNDEGEGEGGDNDDELYGGQIPSFVMDEVVQSYVAPPAQGKEKEGEEGEETAAAAPNGTDTPFQLLSQIPLGLSHASKAGERKLPVFSWRRIGQEVVSRVHIPYLPIFGPGKWEHHKKNLLRDFIAGLTVAIMVIPEAPAFMLLATLSPINGLYTAAIAPLPYAFLGTSNQLAVGPVSLASIFISQSLQSLGLDTSDTSKKGFHLRAQAASVLAFYLFVIYIIMSFLRLGSLLRFLSHSVMSGFVSASGLYVALVQLKHVFKLKVPADFEYNYQRFFYIFTHLPESDVPSTILGGSALVLLLTIKVFKRLYPVTPQREKSLAFRVWRLASDFTILMIVVVTSLICRALEKGGTEMHKVGDLPSGLAIPSFPKIGDYDASAAFLSALPLAVLAYMEASAIARKYAEVHKYPIDGNQDLFALSLSNLLSGCFGGTVCSGSFSRTALAAEVGAKTPLANLVTGVIIALHFTTVMFYIPYCVLGAIIINAVINLIAFKEFYHVLRLDPLSGLVMILTFICTAFISLDDGLLYGTAASIAIILYQLSDVDTVVLGRDAHQHLVSLRDHPQAVSCLDHGIVVVRPNASLFFGNAGHLRTDLEKIIELSLQVVYNNSIYNEGDDDTVDIIIDHGGAKQSKESSFLKGEEIKNENDAATAATSFLTLSTNGSTVEVPAPTRVHHILIDTSAMTLHDLSALGAFADVVDKAHHEKMQIIFSNASLSLQKSLNACGLLEKVGGPLVRLSTEEVYTLLVQGLAAVKAADSTAIRKSI